jgi:hypothetical protein
VIRRRPASDIHACEASVRADLPERHARRVQDPDGHLIGIAASMEGLLGRSPQIDTASELLRCAWELFSLRARRRWLTAKAAGVLIEVLEYATGVVTVL